MVFYNIYFFHWITSSLLILNKTELKPYNYKQDKNQCFIVSFQDAETMFKNRQIFTLQ